MFDKLNQIAQQAATDVSRRQFLGRLGRGAMVLAAAAASVMVTPKDAEAAPRICSIYSESQCVNMPVGTPCFGLDGRKGKCSDAGRPKGSCLCHTSRVKDPRVD